MDRENLGPAERIINTLLAYTDHLYHGRPGVVSEDARFNVGVRWEPVTHKVEGTDKVVYRLEKVGRKTVRTKLGVLQDDGKVVNGRVIGEYRPAGLFPEVGAWMYTQVAEVWKLDNEFAARWASHAYSQDHRDLKVVLAAFMLVQSRKGDPVREGDEVEFHDEDYRDVGEAMMLLYDSKKSNDLNPKMLLRIHDLLHLPEVAEINRELGFGRSTRRPFLGRWPKAVEKWLRFREQNPKMLEGLVKAGFRTTVMDLARRVGYKPESPRFFEILRWKQAQAKDGRREIAIGVDVTPAETWEGLTEAQICERIVQTRPNFKRVVGMVPKNVGLTRAIVAASVEAGTMSDKDLVIYTPTLEELGLLQVQDVREKWETATRNMEDVRAANIAKNVKTKEAREKLEAAADKAVQKAVEESVRNMRIYCMVDVSGSMHGAIEAGKELIAKFLQAFPPDKVHVSVFNTSGREIAIKHASAAGVRNAFRGITAGGGTDYGAGVRALQGHRPADDEDVLFVWIGDECAYSFDSSVQASGLRPVAFGFVKIVAPGWNSGGYSAVTTTAVRLGIPCFMIDEHTFDDPYAIPRTISRLVESTPVGKSIGVSTAPRVSLVDKIVSTNLLQKPVWA